MYLLYIAMYSKYINNNYRHICYKNAQLKMKGNRA